MRQISPLRVLLPVGLGTSLSLIGDTSLYTVLPTHTLEAGITLAAVGVMLSANRWIRLLLNGPIGVAYDRWPRRWLFVPALFVGALSTAVYAFTTGFWPLLIGRLLWGLAWSGIWIGGNSIIIDVTTSDNRGRWIGFYQTAFFLGASGGSLVGGILTDIVGYHMAMAVAAGLTFIGAAAALLFLPETHHLRQKAFEQAAELPVLENQNKVGTNGRFSANGRFLAILGLLGSSRFTMAGLLLPTFGLYLAQSLGDSVQILSWTLGISSLTGIMLSSNSLVAMVVAPSLGSLSDRFENRWGVAAGGLLPGIMGFSLLSFLTPLISLWGMPLTAVASASSQGLSTTLVGDSSHPTQRSKRLGILFSFGDFISAVGPLLAFALIPLIEIQGVYLIATTIYLAMFLLSLQQARPKRA